MLHSQVQVDSSYHISDDKMVNVSGQVVSASGTIGVRPVITFKSGLLYLKGMELLVIRIQ